MLSWANCFKTCEQPGKKGRILRLFLLTMMPHNSTKSWDAGFQTSYYDPKMRSVQILCLRCRSLTRIPNIQPCQFPRYCMNLGMLADLLRAYRTARTHGRWLWDLLQVSFGALWFWSHIPACSVTHIKCNNSSVSHVPHCSLVSPRAVPWACGTCTGRVQERSQPQVCWKLSKPCILCSKKNKVHLGRTVRWHTGYKNAALLSSNC